MSVRILTGDCREQLRTLADQSVQMCVTSPPYFGLRDYGTASWQGGDVGCDHLAGALVSQKSGLRNDGREHVGPYDGEKKVTTGMPYRGICGKCGARRIDQQIGLESTVEAYVTELVTVFREVRRVLRDDGVLFLNLGDSYASAWPCNRRNEVGAGSLPNGKREARPPRMPNGLKEKDLIGVPWRVAFALQADGWYLRSDIIWSKPNPMPESVRDRPTKAHEYIFLLTKSPRYFWDAEAAKEDVTGNTHSRGTKMSPPKTMLNENGSESHVKNNRSFMEATWGPVSARNIRSVWTIATAPFAEAHFATFPPALAERCIKAGTSEKGACGACGAPWVRQTDVSYENPGNRTTNGPRSTENRAITAGFDVRLERRVETTGWQPTCTCDGTWIEVEDDDPALDWIDMATLETAMSQSDRPQQRRAWELFNQSDLNQDHLIAIRAVGITDVGKAQVTQDGFGKNTEEMIRLAAEAKDILAGYYREFGIALGRLAGKPTKRRFVANPDGVRSPVPCVVLDPFGGAGTVSLVAERLGRDSIYIDLSPEYAEMARKRITNDAPMFALVQEG